MVEASSIKLQAPSNKHQAKKELTVWTIHDNVGFINQQKGHMKYKKINHNDLAPWFMADHRDLPKDYLESCEKFFAELETTSNKRQATSSTQLTGTSKQKGIK